MLNNQENNYKNWFKKAEEDELSINSILKEGGAFSTACFLSQQMAEKYLKGLLVFYNKEFLKVHDLIELETLLIKDNSKIKEFHNDLKLLNRYYIETRYPGDYPEFNFEEAQKSYEAAKRIKEFVLGKIR
ncbi:MAG: HEPN domain-containing protein [Candidatus Brennerbacteria bacterium]|nr:HEPN domain-containing protein [Candidatus Brennerbacteria bacterium]